MKHLGYFAILLTLSWVNTLPLTAQSARVASTGGNSPHETTSAVIDGCRVSITYGRPFSKDPKGTEIRKIWGSLVKWDEIWRTGSDEATILITQQPIVMGETTIPAGAYTLWTLPKSDGTAKLIVNKQIGQWGINPRDPKQVYDEKNDVVRVDLKKDTLDKQVDQFTMAVEKNPAGGGTIKLKWETTQFSVPFTIKK